MMMRSSSSWFWKGDVALDQVADHGGAGLRVLEADHRRRAGRRVGPVAAAAVVARLLLARHLARAHLVELLLGAIAAVGAALLEHLAGDRAVAVVALGLEHRLLVGGEAEPLHAVEDRLDRGVGRALAVGVLDAQQEAPAVLAREQVREQRGARAADVQETGRAGREAGDDGHGQAFQRARDFSRGPT
jgi:hypothetical protein